MLKPGSTSLLRQPLFAPVAFLPGSAWTQMQTRHARKTPFATGKTSSGESHARRTNLIQARPRSGDGARSTTFSEGLYCFRFFILIEPPEFESQFIAYSNKRKFLFRLKA